MAYVEICEGKWIAEEAFDRIVAAAKVANVGDCVVLAGMTDDQIVAIMAEEPRRRVDITGISREQLRLALFGKSD